MSRGVLTKVFRSIVLQKNHFDKVITRLQSILKRLAFQIEVYQVRKKFKALHIKIIKNMYLKLLRNDLQQRFDVLKYEIIYTPPYFPKFQPIERVWGWSKNFVAQLFYSGQKLEQTYAQMVAVWYGGTSYKAGKPYSRQGETGMSRSSKIGWGFY